MILYINNFRGFKNTFIPIKDVNFFVGENSTGKTSVLKLIKLLSSPEFWNDQRFETEDWKLGSFSEICSDKDGKSFEIGVYQNKGKEYATVPLLFKFVNNLESPKLKSIRFSFHKYHIEFQLDNAGRENPVGFNASYRLSVTDSIQPEKFNFESWVEVNTLSKKPFLKVESNGLGFNRNSIFHTLHNLVDSISSTDKSVLDNIAFILTPSISAQYIGFQNDVVWFAPIRTEPRKTYDNYQMQFRADGSHIPYLLREIFAMAANTKTVTVGDAANMVQLLQSFGKASGLYERILIKKFGEDRSAPFEIQVELNGQALNLVNVGYGISQVLPILVQILFKAIERKYSLQQPEVHLHPKAQAALGEFFYESWLTESKEFFIETHSDYLVDRFRISMSKNKKNYKKHENKCQVLFFKRGKDGNEVCPIEIEPDGKYGENRPSEFGDFFAREEMDLYSLNFD